VPTQNARSLSMYIIRGGKEGKVSFIIFNFYFYF
jgi:hypothetical protein